MSGVSGAARRGAAAGNEAPTHSDSVSTVSQHGNSSSSPLPSSAASFRAWHGPFAPHPGVVGGGTPIRGEDGGMPIGGGAAGECCTLRDKYMIKTGLPHEVEAHTDCTV